MSVRVHTVLKESTGVGPISRRTESLKWQTAWCAVMRPHWRGFSGVSLRRRATSAARSS